LPECTDASNLSDSKWLVLVRLYDYFISKY
jgi:hypothetical protein